jgi:hypothetical protein
MDGSSAMAATYRRLRQVGRDLNSRLLEHTSKAVLQAAGKRLGILRAGILVFPTEEHGAVLADYIIHDCREGGKNAVDRYLAASPPAPGTPEEVLLRAMRDARFSIFQVREILPGFGVRARDCLDGDEILLADFGFSQTASEGVLIAARVLPIGSFWMTTGAALPVGRQAAAEIDRNLPRIFWARRDGSAAQDRGQPGELSALVLGACLRDDSCQIAFEELDDPARVDRAPAPAAARIGRNDPCPCGSGRKFKKCCA